MIEPMRTLTLTAALAFSTAPAVSEPEPTRGPGDLAVHCGTLQFGPRLIHSVASARALHMTAKSYRREATSEARPVAPEMPHRPLR